MQFKDQSSEQLQIQSTPHSELSASPPLHRGGDGNEKGLLIARGGIKGLEISTFKIKECTGRTDGKCVSEGCKRSESGANMESRNEGDLYK